MNVVKEQITRITISEVPGLDPIRVALDDIGPRQGRITIECYGKAWSAYWGGMGDRTIAEFFADCDVYYLADKLTDIRSSIFDPDKLMSNLKKDCLKQRRDLLIDKDDARELFLEIEEIGHPETVDELYNNHYDLMVRLIGDDWWNGLPEKPNPDYVYLCRIITAVRSALKMKAAA